MQTNELWFVLKCYLNTTRLQIIYMCKQDLAINNLQNLICHKTSLNIHCKYFLLNDLLKSANLPEVSSAQSAGVVE